MSNRRVWAVGERVLASEINAIAMRGGNGFNGPLFINSGTQTINLANASYVIKNYSALGITGSGALAFSNPNTSGTVVIIKVQGDCSLTSTAIPMIELSGFGAAGGISVTNISGNSTSGDPGTTGKGLIYVTGGGNGWSQAGGNGVNSALPVFTPTISSFNHPTFFSKYGMISPGAGGASGGVSGNGGTGVYTSGQGGRGGAGFVLEVGGALNFTKANGISVRGTNGLNAALISGTNNGSAGGAGGGGGMALITYGSAVSVVGTVKVSGGTPGTATAGGVGGSSGGSSAISNGTNGSGSTSGTGADGIAIIEPSFDFS